MMPTRSPGSKPFDARAALVDGLPAHLVVVELVGDAVRDPFGGLGDDAGQVAAHERSPPRWLRDWLPGLPRRPTPRQSGDPEAVRPASARGAAHRMAAAGGRF